VINLRYNWIWISGVLPDDDPKVSETCRSGMFVNILLWMYDN
jgi:hypothetical protein